MRISERITGTIEDWRVRWGKVLKEWMASWFQKGAENLFDAFEPELRDEIRPSLERLKEIEGLPADIKAILDKATEATSFIQMAAILPYLIGMLIGMGMGAAAPMSRIGAYQIDKLVKSARLDPGTITRIWLRDKPLNEKFWQDLRDQGWDEERIDIVKELAKIIPPLADMVRFADFSAFDPEVIARWREFYDAPSFITEPFKLLGITNEAPRDWANKYWFSHYVQPGRFELGEMYRRSEGWKLGATPEAAAKSAELGVTEDDLTLAYRTMAYSEFWQKRLLELSKAIPTRVDVRRWWDMRTIDEPRLRELYLKQGYFDSDLEDYVLWTKVYVAFPDLIARFKNGWITEDDVRSELIALGMPSKRVEEMIQTKIKTAAPERVAAEKTATATEIMKAVKKEYITWSEGIERLARMGYSSEEADFKLKVYVGVAEGSPDTYMEFVDLTERYRQAMGLEAKIPPLELIEASKALKEAKDKLAQAEEKGLKDEKIAPYLQAVSDAEYRYRQLLVQWQAKKS